MDPAAHKPQGPHPLAFVDTLVANEDVVVVHAGCN